jgi:hypothetical protein
MSDEPPISIELVHWLSKRFAPVTYTPETDLRTIDFKSGQHSVVVFLKSLNEKQTNGSKHSFGAKPPASSL